MGAMQHLPPRRYMWAVKALRSGALKIESLPKPRELCAPRSVCSDATPPQSTCCVCCTRTHLPRLKRLASLACCCICPRGVPEICRVGHTVDVVRVVGKREVEETVGVGGANERTVVAFRLRDNVAVEGEAAALALVTRGVAAAAGGGVCVWMARPRARVGACTDRRVADRHEDLGTAGCDHVAYVDVVVQVVHDVVVRAIVLVVPGALGASGNVVREHLHPCKPNKRVSMTIEMTEVFATPTPMYTEQTW